MAVVQIMVVDLIVASRWPAYNFHRYIISDLGITQCASIDGLWTCSPWHLASDISWIVAGLCTILGAWCSAPYWAASRTRNLGLSALAVSGAAFISTALNPENLRKVPHLASAGITIIFASMGVLLLGWATYAAGRRRWGVAGIFCGFAGLTAEAFVILNKPERLQGAVERLAVWPQLLWIVITGALITRTAWRRHVACRRPPRTGL
ncbi:DUF998 domain-containing protein [Streptomyces sp. NPDC127084]|uniref:DUF998 domain-containing protein n=1 Tax=Streptomyces sp. NPDC127084 TaxID=3347133 RepID=UPI003655CA5A